MSQKVEEPIEVQLSGKGVVLLFFAQQEDWSKYQSDVGYQARIHQMLEQKFPSLDRRVVAIVLPKLKEIVERPDNTVASEEIAEFRIMTSRVKSLISELDEVAQVLEDIAALGSLVSLISEFGDAPSDEKCVKCTKPCPYAGGNSPSLDFRSPRPGHFDD